MCRDWFHAKHAVCVITHACYQVVQIFKACVCVFTCTMMQDYGSRFVMRESFRHVSPGQSQMQDYCLLSVMKQQCANCKHFMACFRLHPQIVRLGGLLGRGGEAFFLGAWCRLCCLGEHATWASTLFAHSTHSWLRHHFMRDLQPWGLHA